VSQNQTVIEQLTLPDDTTPTLLPDIPGKVHGIVQLEPFVRIQCDGCGYLHDGAPGKTAIAILTCGINFSPRRYRHPRHPDTRRLCHDCRKSEWNEDARDA
jgi:hypothetical protein